MADEALLADIRALGHGAVGTLPALLDSPHLAALRSDPLIRDLVADLDLRALIDELQDRAQTVATR